MSEALKVIANRRSIRAYKQEQITDSELQQILDATLLAPSAINLQKWHFTVVQNSEVISRMVKTIKEIIVNSGNEVLKQRAASPDYHTFHNAPTVIIISGEEKSPYTPNDCSAAAENILLAAEALNIGSCWIGSVLPLFGSEKGPKFKQELGIPEDYKVVCAISLGYKAAENPTAPSRNKNVINYVK